MDLLIEVAAVCRWNFRGLLARMRTALVAVLGFLAVVLVFVAVLAIRGGLLAGLQGKGTDAVAIVYSKVGNLSNTQLKLVSDAPGVARSAGEPLVSGTLVTELTFPRWKPGLLAQVTLRGVGGPYPAVVGGFHLVRGRYFHPGVNELVVGAAAERLFAGLHPGEDVTWSERKWRIVGVYETGNSVRDSSILTDVRQMQTLDSMSGQYSAIFARLTSPAAFAGFHDALAHDPRLNAAVERLSAYDQEAGQGLNSILTVADGIITLLMAVGAVFGALNIMYSNVARRSREIATLRALGFRRAPVLVAVLLEAMLLALVGGALGIAIAYLAFDNFQASTSTGGALIGFRFVVTAHSILIAAGLTFVMGFFGGLFPSVRAARLPVARALREA